MPITLHPSNKSLSTVDTSSRAQDGRALLSQSCDEVSRKCGEIFQSSFITGAEEISPNSTDLSKSLVCPAGNGLVDTAVGAYNRHHHLVLRPDDVWIAILAQFNLYINANAEALRHLFVQHQGKKELIISSAGSRYTVDFGYLAQRMSYLIQENVTDPDLREWIIPKFSTTTVNDRIVSSVILMATLKSYFSYKISLLCGLPAVTLLGEKSDWETILLKAEKLKSYGDQTKQWQTLLKPVLEAFVRSFDEPESERTKEFWQRIAHYTGGGSGPTFLSGWITAFCFFDKEGKPLYSERTVGKTTSWDGQELGSLQWDGVEYHRIDSGDIPPAYAEVDVKLDDNGLQIDTVMVAGLVGMEITSSGVRGGNHNREDDTALMASEDVAIREETVEDHEGKEDIVVQGIPNNGDITVKQEDGQETTVLFVSEDVLGSGEGIGDHDGKDDTVQPVAGWWIFEEKEVKNEIPEYEE